MQTTKKDLKLSLTNKEEGRQEEEEEEEEEEETVFYKKLSNDSKRTRRITCSSSPEPQQQQQLKKGRKRTILNPNKTDKAGRTKLFYATSQGHLDKVKELIENGANVNFKDNAGWTPLHEAALKGQYETGKYLILCGADVNARGFGQDTPLHDASSNARLECVRLLVEHGADVFALNESKQRPIDVCESKECQKVLKAKMKQLDRLIARDKDGRSLLHHACIENSIEKTKLLLEQGANVNAKDNKEWTPLHFACSNGHLNIAKVLIEQGAVVNILGSEDMDTPLHQASKQGHEDIVRYLINSSDVDVNMKNKYNQKAYDVSAPYPVIRQILTARMDEVRLEKEACNALDEIASKTASRNEPERQLTREQRKIQHVMRVFANLEGDKKTLSSCEERTSMKRKRRRKSISVESEDIITTISASSSNHRKKPSNSTSLDPFKKDTSGRTNLHKHAARGNQDKVQALLELGADPNEKDHAGWTPLHEAALRGRIEVIKILLKHGADINAKGGTDSDTPLHDATENNHCEVVELLLEHGANPFAINANDVEPLDIAIENDFVDIIMVLQAASPVIKKKKKSTIKIEEDDDDDDDSNKHQGFGEENQHQPEFNNKSHNSVPKRPTKKRRLIQAADLEKSHSSDEDSTKIKIEKEDESEPVKSKHIPDKKNIRSIKERRHVDPHSPIPTPPPEPWIKQREDFKSPSLLYSIQLPNSNFYVIDIQVCLFLGINTAREFWTMYPHLSKLSITSEQKRKLWRPLKPLLVEEELETFLAKDLYFVHFEDVINLIKSDYNYLSQSLITVTLDMDYQLKKLPPKVDWKTKYRLSCS
ncbi:hypothetical protein G6F43_000969 [Rhizopus delemar]|nr:hypothetical protein G6F43_000969 [Rhizopus delemar]